MIDIVDWPMAVLCPRLPIVEPDYMTRPDQQATNGMRRSPGVTATAYRLHALDILVRSEAQARTMNAMIALMEGNSTLVRWRLPSIFGIDGPMSATHATQRRLYPRGVPFASDVLFSGGAGFALSYRSGVLAEGAAVGARTIHVAYADELPAGTLISIAEFVYTVRRSWMDVPGVNRMELSPILRQAAPAGTEVDLAPVFVGACVTSPIRRPAMKTSTIGNYSLEFTEDLTRLVDLT